MISAAELLTFPCWKSRKILSKLRARAGDTHLGGDDIDQKIIQYFIDEFKRKRNGCLEGPTRRSALKRRRRKAKHELSSTLQTEVNIPFLTADSVGPKHFTISFTRAKLEELTHDFIDRSIKLTKQVVEDSGLKLSDIHEVVMVGGQTRMPLIIEEVKKLFGKEPHKDINPDEVVALGAAVQGGIMQGRHPRRALA